MIAESTSNVRENDLLVYPVADFQGGWRSLRMYMA